MILFNQDVLFVHNPKTAGTSMLLYLERVLRPPVYRAGVRELGTNHPSLSLALGYACATLGIRPDDFKRIISAIRNPFSRELSMYVYFRDVLNRSPTVTDDLNDARIEGAVRMAAALNFSEYLSWLKQEFGTCDIWASRCFYQTSEGHVPESLSIVRTESIEHDVVEALSGISLNPNAPSFPRLNASDLSSSSGLFFTEEAAALVLQSYNWIFDRGYYPATAL